VIEVGAGVTGWRVGDRAATLQRMSCGACPSCRAGRGSLCRRDHRFFGEELAGGYASLMVAPVGGIGRVPDGMPWEVAATVCCTAGTAVHVVRTRGRVAAGETVLVTGASGGVGLQIVQLARLHGARVLAVTSSAAKTEALRQAGASEVIVAESLQFAADVRRLTGGEGAHVAIELVGSATFTQTLKSMVPGGRVVVVGNLESRMIDLDPSLVTVEELEILGAYATTQTELETALRLTHEGLLSPFVTEVLPLSAAAEAHRRLENRLENREVAGRLVLSPDAPPRSVA
jgi:D-arabinose 1-dehydrogenase-like Zn-dependent alcohol dehydrogenase